MRRHWTPLGPITQLIEFWNFYDEIIKNNKAFIDNGIEFINIKDLQNG